MGYPEIGPEYSVNLGSHTGGMTTRESGNNKLSFNDVFRDSRTENENGDDMIPENINSVSAGHTIEMLGARSKIKEASFEEELDSMISFDEIEELDDITDDAVSTKLANERNILFRGMDVFSDFQEDESEELTMMADFEELEEII